MTEISNDVGRIIDMDAILGSLSEDRPVFHSESDSSTPFPGGSSRTTPT